jgi:hypothetical protein
MENGIKFFLVVFLGICTVFAAPDFFGGLEQDGQNFLEQPILEVEKKAEELSVRFAPEEAQVLDGVVSEVRSLLNKSDAAESVLNSELQARLISLEEEWTRREGARIVVKLLEAIRIKSQLYVQNMALLSRLKPGTEEYEKTKARADKYYSGIELSNDTLAQTVEEGRSDS